MEKDRKNVLVVDDDPMILKTLENILRSEGYHVDTAETGKEAIERSHARFHNLALLDIKLPDMEGTQLLTELHRDTPRMMKIMVTGYPSRDNAIKSLNLGADAYVIKPVDPEKLLGVVEEKLKEQEEAERMSEDRVAEWIKNRAKKLERNELNPKLPSKR